MCGICGIVSVSEFRQPESARLWTDAMLEALSHRGPDDTGIVSSKSAVLGATRLAIRGAHDGHQPMVDETSGVVAVCNVAGFGIRRRNTVIRLDADGGQ